MKKKLLLFLMLAWATCPLMASTTLPLSGEVVKADDPHIQYIGRVSLAKPHVARFNYPGTTIVANFEGTSLKMICRPKTGFFMAQVDGAEAFKVSFDSEKDSVVTLATALPQGVHTVKVMYVIEGLYREPEFHGFVLDKGCHLVAPPTLPERKIEFIGNSITCGYGKESIVASEPFEESSENTGLTYAGVVSDCLGSRYHCVARSGIGVYRNYDGPKTGSKEDMSWQYPYTLFNKHDEPWDFSRFQPQLVCVNLGTNDFSTSNYDTKLYQQAYREFLEALRQYYPKAKIVMLTGPMLGEKENSTQQGLLNDLCKEFNKKGDKQVYRFDFTPQTGDLGYGASWHPSKRQQEKMAAELLPYLRKLMEW